MPAKNRFQAYPGEVAKQKLEVIRKHEQDKAGTKPDGTPIKINDTWLLENFIDVRHEALTAGRSNRERIADIVTAVTTMDEKIDRLITFLMEERKNV
jgi:hypothetical protein